MDIEGARPIQYLDRRSESGLFVCIGSSLVSLAQIKQEFGGTCRLSHATALPMRTKVPDASSVLPLCLLVKLFRLASTHNLPRYAMPLMI